MEPKDAGETNGTNGVDPKSTSNSKESTPVANNNGLALTYEEELCLALEEEARLATEARSCTGSLGIHPLARDIKIDNFSVTFYGQEFSRTPSWS